MGYTKLFDEILASTIWQAPDHVRLVWITMLAMKDDRHEVMASIPGLAKNANVTIEQCENAIQELSSPDPYSRSQEYEGRRIEAVRGGWHILNGEYYRQKRSEEDKREYMRKYMKKYRQLDHVNDSVKQSKQMLNNVSTVNTTEQNRTDHNRTIKSLSAKAEVPRGISFPKNFLDFWNLYPKKVGKMAAWRAWQRAKIGEEVLPALQTQIQSDKWQEQNGRFIPHPTTWLNAGGWMDEVTKQEWSIE